MRRFGVVMVSLFGALSCAEASSDLPWSGSVVDSAGVAVWTIPAEDSPADVTLERLGGFAMPDTGWAIWPDGIAVDTVSRAIYVLDENTPRVLVFDFEGRMLEQIGRKGQGPGEYDSPTGLDLGPNRELLVMDPGAGFIHRWSAQREYVDRDPIPLGYWGPGFRVTREGYVYTTAGGVESGTMTEALVTITSERVDTLSALQSSWRPIEMPCGRVPVPEVFSWSAVWDASSRHVARMSVPRYEVVLSEGAVTTAIFRRQILPRKVGVAEAEASVGNGPLQFLVEGCGMTASGVVRDAGFVPQVSPVFLLSVDPSGRVWAAHGEPPAVESIDLFDPHAGYLGSVSSPAIPVAFVDASRYVTIVDGQWGPVLEFWRVVGGM